MPDPRIGIAYWLQGDANPDVTMDKAINALAGASGAMQILTFGNTTAPATPVDGDWHFTGVVVSPTDPWATKSNKIAGYFGGWIFFDPWVGLIIEDQSNGRALSQFDGATFSPRGEGRRNFIDIAQLAYGESFGQREMRRVNMHFGLPNTTTIVRPWSTNPAGPVTPRTDDTGDVRGCAYNGTRVIQVPGQSSLGLITMEITAAGLEVTSSFNASAFSADVIVTYSD